MTSRSKCSTFLTKFDTDNTNSSPATSYQSLRIALLHEKTSTTGELSRPPLRSKPNVWSGFVRYEYHQGPIHIITSRYLMHLEAFLIRQ